MSRDTQEFIALELVSGGDGALIEVEGPRATTSMRHRRAPLANPDEQFRVLHTAEVTSGPTGSGHFEQDLKASGWPALKPAKLDIFQINLGKLCNMTCRHCHVDSGPDRTEENMDRETVEACLRAIDRSGAHTVDLTGGAPELNPHFEYLVDQCVKRGKHVMDRCNLTILTTRRYQHLPQWFAERSVEVICSLPHYRKLGGRLREKDDDTVQDSEKDYDTVQDIAKLDDAIRTGSQPLRAQRPPPAREPGVEQGTPQSRVPRCKPRRIE